ncbi:hypothetical protein CONCODRAFT_8862 [Conidiobolus coronatus NRRL 28638]|uniref:Uncharacterized protein n=1 Tax=Conidiobolus coronatus (strain ATCC 28846 / CBS 209.66 / NRRL 28638) TaxID=796925 RepID=A0A137P168_CONC2|nr:hypothetical protein CONCODRAFT_8862 [Conidiobolus coronatus NRRL 28638]|eukprot:KXN68805.1 hypothetical protein CONCODRAFT_8862 [Conidiobolus coronatus NRRL 28638]
MNADDVVSTLFINGILEEKDGRFILNVDVGKIEAHLNKLKSKKLLSAKAEHLRWSPFVNKLVPTAPSSSKASSENKRYL